MWLMQGTAGGIIMEGIDFYWLIDANKVMTQYLRVKIKGQWVNFTIIWAYRQNFSYTDYTDYYAAWSTHSPIIHPPTYLQNQ